MANGSESFTAMANDSVGNVSPLSSPLAMTLSVPVNLIANGNFATGDFTGWTLGGNYTWTYGQEITIDPGSNGNTAGVAPNAVRMNSVGPSTSDGTLSQTIATVAGQTYTVNFWLESVGSGNNDFKAIWNGQTLLALTNKVFGYTEYSYTVMATGSQTTLGFSAASLNGASSWYLDNVSVAAGTAGPTITAIAESPSSGDLAAGNVVTITLAMGGGCNGQHHRRHADVDPQRRRHRDLYGRVRHQCADLQLHRWDRPERGIAGCVRDQPQRRDHSG